MSDGRGFLERFPVRPCARISGSSSECTSAFSGTVAKLLWAKRPETLTAFASVVEELSLRRAPPEIAEAPGSIADTLRGGNAAGVSKLRIL